MQNNKIKLNIQLFASPNKLNGSSTASGCDCQITFSESVDKVNNKSTLTATFQVKKTGSGTTNGTFSGTVTIDGTDYSISKYNAWSWGDWCTVGSASKTITHDGNGSKSIKVSAKFTQTGTSMAGTYTVSSQTVTLTAIQRYSTLTAVTDFSVGASSTPCTITQYSGSGATDTLTMTIGNNTYGSNLSFTSSAISFDTNAQNFISTNATEIKTPITFTLNSNISGTSSSTSKTAKVSSMSSPIYRNIVKKSNGHYQVAINGVVDTLFPGVIQRYNDDGSVASDWELLYAPSSATSGTFQLSETAANFKFLIFIYQVNTGAQVGGTRSSIVYNPNGKIVELNGDYDDKPSSTTSYYCLYMCNAKYTINGTSVTKNQEIRWRLTESDATGKNTRTTGTDNIKIVAVIGIRGYTNNL